MTATQQNVGIGALGGAAVGGVAGSFGGNARMGALLGAGVGGLGGYLHDQLQRSRRTYR
ncbi:YMGG-like glycine zipper-containing protein [Falsiroseomonas oryzae]|uniref:YMGG-like glycine zipper-containing protein n=1 Tax=Falsiroseomonas oryzae TaxID=2766473 RepID=UPI0022EB57CE|nr:YMGG-like glycine zipper-containing protein [Roseomonas sp. MO-31]